MTNEKAYTVLEIVCVFFWFMLDGCWLMEWRVPTYVFSAVALMASLAMWRFIKDDTTVKMVNAADGSWLLCNCAWATGDLDHSKTALLIAKLLFAFGFTCCVLAFAFAPHGRRLSVLILSRIRILKFFVKRGGVEP